MGQIQNAISGLVSTAIGATIAKDIKDTKEKAAYTEAVAVSPALEEEIAKEEAEIATTEKELDILKKGNVPLEGGGFRANIFGEDLAPEIAKRELALKTKTGKVQAKRLQWDDYKKTIENYRKKRGIE